MEEVKMLISGKIRKFPDGSVLCGRVWRDKQIYYVWPAREKPISETQKRLCAAFGEKSKRAYAIKRDPEAYAVWQNRYNEYLGSLEEDESPKWCTVLGYIIAHI